jgi:hypothetical protein
LEQTVATYKKEEDDEFERVQQMQKEKETRVSLL